MVAGKPQAQKGFGTVFGVHTTKRKHQCTLVKAKIKYKPYRMSRRLSKYGVLKIWGKTHADRESAFTIRFFF